MKAKILGIAIAIAMVSMTFAAFPATAADADLVWQYCTDYTPGVITAEYHNTAGIEGWTLFWYEQAATKPIYRGTPAALAYMYAGDPNYLTAGAWVLDNMYPDPSGWLYGQTVGIIMEDASGYGAFGTATSDGSGEFYAPVLALQQLPIATATANGADVDLTWPAMAGVAGYMVYQSTSNVDWDDTGAGGPAFWTLVGGTVAAPIAVTSWTHSGALTSSGNTYYYSIKPVVAGVGANVDFKYGSQPSAGILDAGASNEVPVLTAADALPDPYGGDISAEYVTLSATATDADSGPAALTYEYDLHDSGTWTTFVSGDQLSVAGFTEGLHSLDIRAYDGADPSNVIAADFTITDITPPEAMWTAQPGSTIYVNDITSLNDAITCVAEYEDFMAYNPALSTFWYSVDSGAAVNVAWTVTDSWIGSFGYELSATIPAGVAGVGQTLEWGGSVRDLAAASNLATLAAGGPVTLDNAPDIINPFAVFGSVVLYDGTSVGGYNPIQAGIGVPVDVTYTDFVLGGLRTLSTTTDATGFYTVDIMNAILADPYGIEIEAGPFTGYNNMGYNSMPALDYSVTGGILTNVICGIPYEVVITVPAPLFNTNAGALMATTYVILDIDGIPAQGYFSFEGAMDWTSTDLAFTNVDGPITFNGVADAGTYSGDLRMMTAGAQTIRIADEDGGVAPPAAVGTNMFLTPWGDFGPVLIGGVSTPVYLDDWDEIIVNVMADQFFWNLIAGGWNLVSAPTSPVDKGLDGNFDADDAMNVCILSDPLNVGLQMATKTGAATYNVVLLGVGELGAFDIDGVHGYWIFSDVDDVVGFYGIDYDIATDPTLNVVTTNAGWNILGFTHNYNGGIWNNLPTASDFCDGTIGPGLGAATMIIATEWDYLAQWYYSYVNTPTFVMPTRDWTWDFSYAGSPGNGFYLWTEVPIVITFNVVY